MHQSNWKPTTEFESARDTPRTHESRRRLTWICGSLKKQIKQFEQTGAENNIQVKIDWSGLKHFVAKGWWFKIQRLISQK